MSKESLKLFIQKLDADTGFLKEFRGCKDDKECMAFVKKAGFDLTDEEVSKACSGLSDSCLDNVSGGLRDYTKEETTDIGDNTKDKI